MSSHDQFSEDKDFKYFLRELVNRECLESPALGITKLVIDKGLGVLSPKQLYVFNQYVLGNNTKECQRCSCDIPWSEMTHALDNGGLCNYCWHMTEKSKDE